MNDKSKKVILNLDKKNSINKRIAIFESDEGYELQFLMDEIPFFKDIVVFHHMIYEGCLKKFFEDLTLVKEDSKIIEYAVLKISVINDSIELNIYKTKEDYRIEISLEKEYEGSTQISIRNYSLSNEEFEQFYNNLKNLINV